MSQREFWRASKENDIRRMRSGGTTASNSSHPGKSRDTRDKSSMRAEAEAAADNNETKVKIMRRQRRGKRTGVKGPADSTPTPRGPGGGIRTQQAEGDGTP